MPPLTAAQVAAYQHTLGLDLLGAGPWQGHVPLGNGSYGVVGAFFHTDVHHSIQNRVAVKDSYLTQTSWNNAHSWTGRPVVAGAGPILREIGAMRAVEEAGCRNIVWLWGTAVWPENRRYRLTMEFVPYGDLFHGPWDQYRNAGHPIPEPAIWAILWGLVEACIVLEQGHATTPVPNWQPTIHRDFKLDNIFLGDFPSHVSDPQAPFPTYPVPKLGDFGFAIQINQNASVMNPSVSGAQGFAAPEEMLGQTRWQLTSKTNVFGIGINILSLMTRTMRHAPKDLAGWQAKKSIYFPAITKVYSPELRNIIKRCLYKTAAKRPSALQLRTLLEEQCCGPEDKSSGLFSVFPSQRARHRTGSEELLGLPANTYAIGAQFV